MSSDESSMPGLVSPIGSEVEEPPKAETSDNDDSSSSSSADHHTIMNLIEQMQKMHGRDAKTKDKTMNASDAKTEDKTMKPEPFEAKVFHEWRTYALKKRLLKGVSSASSGAIPIEEQRRVLQAVRARFSLPSFASLEADQLDQLLQAATQFVPLPNPASVDPSRWVPSSRRKNKKAKRKGGGRR